MARAEVPLACTLDADAMAARVAWIRQITRRDLVAHHLDGATLRLTFRRQAEEEILRIMALERDCCAFLDFALDAGPTQVVLTITAPPAVAKYARVLFAQFLPDGAAPARSTVCACCADDTCA
jgi:hypothetical protein